MILQDFNFNMESFLTPILDVGVLIVFIILMMILYAKLRILPIITLVMLISLIIGVVSIQLQYNPFTPWFQIFFILFQSVFFLRAAFEYKELKSEMTK